MFNVTLADYGAVGLEYWVLGLPAVKEGVRRRSKPSEGFVDPGKPVILTHNGQNQGELSGRLVREAADLPFLQSQGRLICHVNCDRLSGQAKRSLFASTREQSREGPILGRIREEIVRALRADDDLIRLNEDAREQSLRERDVDFERRMRRRVAKLLNLKGASYRSQQGPGAWWRRCANRRDQSRSRSRQSILPTYITIKWPNDNPIRFHAGRRRYIRLETDANSDYHDVNDITRSRINVVVGDDLRVFGTSPLKGGRMRVGLECLDPAVMGASGTIRVELYRAGLPALSDGHGYVVTEAPELKEDEQKNTLPEF